MKTVAELVEQHIGIVDQDDAKAGGEAIEIALEHGHGSFAENLALRCDQGQADHYRRAGAMRLPKDPRFRILRQDSAAHWHGNEVWSLGAHT